MLAICASHSPLMLVDMPDTSPGRHERFFGAMRACAQQIADYDPELVVVFGPDHFNGLFYDLMPSFCVGVAAEATRDWRLPAGALDVPRDIALDCARALRREDLDVAISYRMRVDHGTTIPLHKLVGTLDRYPTLPIVVNCAADPRPSFARVRKLGDAVGRFLATLRKRIVVIGSGGLSHDPPTPRLAASPPKVAARLIDRHTPSAEELDRREKRVVAAAHALLGGGGPCLPPSERWDRAFLDDLLEQDLAAFDRYSDEAMDREAGFGSHEVRCWVATFAAMQALGPFEPQLHCYDIIPEWITGMAVVSGRHEPSAVR